MKYSDALRNASDINAESKVLQSASKQWQTCEGPGTRQVYNRSGESGTYRSRLHAWVLLSLPLSLL